MNSLIENERFRLVIFGKSNQNRKSMNAIKPFWVLMLILCCSSAPLAQKSNLTQILPTPSLGKQTSKVSPVLLKLYENDSELEETAENTALRPNMDLLMIKDDKVLVEATAKKDGGALVQQFKSINAEDIYAYQRVINAWVSIKNIPQMEEMEELRYVKPVYRPMTNIGSAHSEGDSALAAKMARKEFCLDGSGVKIGVLSDTYNSLGGAAAGVTSGDLPGVGNPNGYTTPVTVVADLNSGSDEGRAMCEIVHDLAPGGQLFYATAFTGQAGFAGYIEDLYDLHDCDVIVDDVSYYEEPFYMDGLIAQACDYVNSNGVAYFSSAGNQAQASYEAPFDSTSGSGWHDFDPGPGVDNLQSVSVNAGSKINLVLQWDDPWGSLTPNGAQTDLNLYIYDATGTFVLLSSLRNNVVTTFDPTEFISGTTSGSGTVTFNIAIYKRSGPVPSTIKWVNWGASGLTMEYASTTPSGQSTCVGHSNAAGAVAVGASAWFSSPAYGTNPPVAEWFTSSGGTQIRFDLNGNSITPIDRLKPEISATDGTSNTFFGSNNFFFGTSAAAPHAAAVAALMVQANTNQTPTEIRDILKNSAIDMNTPGFDYLTGAGLIQADVAVQEVYDNLCNVSSIRVHSSPILEPGDTTYSVGIMVNYAGATCNDSLVVNGKIFEITQSDSMNVMLGGLPADGLPVDVTASFSKSSGCSLTTNTLYIAPTIPTIRVPIDTLVISEIMYDAPETGQDSSEFIEIYNPMSTSVNMTGFYFSEGVSFIFGNVTLLPKSYVVVCGDSLSLYNNYGASAYEWSGVLNNGGEDIVLKDANGNTLDSVFYDDSSPWPVNAKGDGPSIVLCDVSSDNNLGSNWTESTSLTGTSVNGKALKGSPGMNDAACGSCPAPDSTFATIISCDSSLIGSSSTLFSNVSNCDSVHTITTIYDAGDTTMLAPISVCAGDSVMIFAEWQNTATVYYDTLLNVNGCDSIIAQQLIINPNYSTALSIINICSGDSLMIFGKWQSIGGVYYDSLQTQNGCDSIISQELVVDSIINSSGIETICFGDSVLIFGKWEMMSGVYSDTLTSNSGCDSVHTITLNVLPITTGSSTMQICAGDSVLIGSNFYGIAGVYSDTVSGVNTCDSIVSITLTVNPLDTTYQNTTTGDPLQAGVFDTTYTNQNGCDSTVITTVTYVPTTLDTLVISEIMYNPPEGGTDIHEYIEVYNPGSVAVDMTGYVISDAVDYTFGNVSIASGGYVVVCKDSLALYSKFVASGYEWSGTLSNGGETILLKDALGNTIDSVKYTKSGSWPKGADGDGPSIVLCDWTTDNTIGSNWTESTSSTGMVVNGNILTGSPGAADAACSACPTADSTFIDQVTCDSTQQGVVVVKLTNQNGCDSIVTTTTVFDPGSLTALADKMICDGDSALIFGNFQNMAGTYYDTLGNQNGCDSILSCRLMVKPTYQDTVQVQICDGDSVLIDGTYQTTSGFYTQVFTTTTSCDSMVTTEVMVLPEIMTASSEFICEGDSILMFGNYQTKAGVYSDTSKSNAGCDSIHTINLTVKPTPLGMVADSICPGESLFVGGAIQTTAGVYYDTLAVAGGCDSIVVTTLSIRTDPGCNGASAGDSVTIVTGGSGWMKSTVTNLAEAGGSEWKGVSSLPTLATFSIPAEVGQPKPWHSIDSVVGAKVFKSGNGVTFFRTTFSLTVDTGVSTQIRSFMDDGMEIYINGNMLAREDDRDVTNATGVQHHLVIHQNGNQQNGAGGDKEFDLVNNYRMDSLVRIGNNELIIALRNGTQSYEKGGFSFRMDIKTGQPYMPVLTGYIVSDAEWDKSSVTTAGGSSWKWSGINSIPAANTFTEKVELGQPYGWYSTEEVENSFAIEAKENVTYYRRRFSLVDSADVNVRLRSTFDENLMIFVNNTLIAGHFQHGLTNRALPGHDVDYPTGGTPVNGNMGGDMFMQVENVDFNQVLRKGDNYITVALQNRSNDRGGFSLRMDLDKSGNPVIRKNTPQEGGSRNALVELVLDFEIYPNPTSGFVNINLLESPTGDNEVLVTDLNGKVLLKRALVNPETGSMDIDLGFLPKGMYMIRVRSGDVFKGKPLVRF